MKRIATRSLGLLMAVLCLFAAFPVTASAKAPDTAGVQYTGFSLIYADIDIQSGRASCYGYADLYDGYTATLTVHLMKDGTSYTSWSKSGSGELRIDEYYYVPSHHNYTTRVEVDVTDSNGVTYPTQSIETNVFRY